MKNLGSKSFLMFAVIFSVFIVNSTSEANSKSMVMQQWNVQCYYSSDWTYLDSMYCDIGGPFECACPAGTDEPGGPIRPGEVE